MEARRVAAGRGWQWIAEGFRLFRQNPVIWIALFFIYLLIGMMLSVIKVVGPIVLNLLAPVFMAGFMLGCRALESGEELEINHLFAGFKRNTAQLITVGGMYLAGMIAIIGIVYVLTGSPHMDNLFSGNADGKLMDPGAESKSLLELLILMAAVLPLVMAYWFAPPLVLFHDLKAQDAMKLSFLACMRNLLPFLIYGIASALLLVVAMIPFGLGLLVMIPTMTASLYASYKDIFNIVTLERDDLLSDD